MGGSEVAEGLAPMSDIGTRRAGSIPSARRARTSEPERKTQHRLNEARVPDGLATKARRNPVREVGT